MQGIISYHKKGFNCPRKRWIISSVSPKGELIIDDGAKKALKNRKSLLAAGIKKVNGNFKKIFKFLIFLE